MFPERDETFAAYFAKWMMFAVMLLSLAKALAVIEGGLCHDGFAKGYAAAKAQYEGMPVARNDLPAGKYRIVERLDQETALVVDLCPHANFPVVVQIPEKPETEGEYFEVFGPKVYDI